MVIEISAEAAAFVREHGGRLWVWAARPRVCCAGSPAWMHAATDPPGGLSGFSRAVTADVEVHVRGVGQLFPDVLEIALRGTRRPRLAAYWDGCLMAMT